MAKFYVTGAVAALACCVAAPAMAASPDWSGVYVGVNAGGNLPTGGDAKTVGTAGFQPLVPTLAPAVLDTNENTFAGGGQIGFNLQSGSLIYGMEADLAYLGAKKSDSFTSTATVLGTTLTTSATHQVDYLGTVRGRLGVAASDRLMVYATGGLAYGRVKNAASVIANAAPDTLYWTGANSSTRTGFAAGAGAEYALGDRVSIRGEYLYYDLGSTTVTAAGSAGVRAVSALDGIDYVESTSAKGSIVRLGVNFKI